jgi:low temperature requirement protein LtrA
VVIEFVLLFFPLWWAWVNLMISNNLYGSRYPSMGLFVVAAMPGPAAMAIAMAAALRNTGGGMRPGPPGSGWCCCSSG